MGHAAGLHCDDRLDPCGGSRRRHEFAGVLDRFDIEQNGPRLVVEREIIQQIGDIDVELIANRHDARKAYAALCRPVHHAGGNGARLRDQREISRKRHVRGEACVEICARHHDAKTIRSDQPHSVLVRGKLSCIRQRARTVTEPRRNDDCAGRALFSGLFDKPWNRCGWCGDDHEFRRKRQFCQEIDRCDAVDLGIMRIDQPKLAFESGLANVSKDRPADRPLPRTGAHKRDRMRRKQIG